MISADPRVMHGQAVIAGTRMSVSVILDCLAAGTTAEEITAEYPTVTVAGIRAVAGYGAALAREELLPIPADDDTHTVWVVYASPAHPKQTEGTQLGRCPVTQHDRRRDAGL